jgi:hypothetical protein
MFQTKKRVHFARSGIVCGFVAVHDFARTANETSCLATHLHDLEPN